MSYYNTTQISTQQLLNFESKAQSQERGITSFMLRYCKPVSAEDIQDFATGFKNTPITSIRRALHNLKDDNQIIIVGQKDGNYGRPVSIYIIKNTTI